MKAKVLQEATYLKDTGGKPLEVGDVAEIDPSLGNQWAGIGLVQILEHDTPPPGSGSRVMESPPSEPEDDEANGRIFKTENGSRVRDYLAEWRERRKAKKQQKRKENKNDGDENGIT